MLNHAELIKQTSGLLDQCECWIRRYVVLSEDQSAVIALWMLHTWVTDASDFTPYLHITAPESGCGKSRLLEALAPLVRKPWKTDAASKAVIVRKIDAEHPTLLLDEADAAFNGNAESAEALRGVLNAGFRRNGTYSCCETDSKGVITCRDFFCFSPKAIAGIGRLPHTVESRSILISMRRKNSGEVISRLRLREVEEAAAPISSSLRQWSKQALPILRQAEPMPLDQLTDRQQDVCEPLLAIADLADGTWPRRARSAMQKLFREAGAKSLSVSLDVLLLRDIRGLFEEREEEDRLASAEIVKQLLKREEQPWAEARLTVHQLAKRLGQFGIRPCKMRLGDQTQNGYYRAHFIESWRRYCPDPVKAGTFGTSGTGDGSSAEVQ